MLHPADVEGVRRVCAAIARGRSSPPGYTATMEEPARDRTAARALAAVAAFCGVAVAVIFIRYASGAMTADV